MDDTQAERKVGTLGEMVRNARLALNMSLEELGDGKFSPAYIVAVEHGTVLPSSMAIERVLAPRLGLASDQMLAAMGEPLPAPSIPALVEDLYFQFSYVKAVQSPADMEVAFRLIASIEDGIAPYRDLIPSRVLSHIPYLRGRAYLQIGDSTRGQHELEDAVELASGDVTASAKAHNMLGVAFYMQDDVDRALHHHLECVHHAQSGALRDPTLLHSIYRNTANDYLLIQDSKHALAMYENALRTLKDMNDIERQAAVYWGMAMAHDYAGDLPHAKLFGQRARDIYTSLNKHIEEAEMALNLAELLVKANQLPDALELLDHARPILEENGSDTVVALGILYKTYAEFYLKDGKHDLAVDYIQRSFEISEAISREQEESGHIAPGSVHFCAMVLWTAALIASDVNKREEAELYFQKALTWTDRTGFRKLYCDICSSFAEIIARWGDFKRAVDYYRAALEYRHKPGQEIQPH